MAAAVFLSPYLSGSLPCLTSYNRKIKCVECVVKTFPTSCSEQNEVTANICSITALIFFMQHYINLTGRCWLMGILSYVSIFSSEPKPFHEFLGHQLSF